MPEIPLVELVAAISSALLTILGGIASTNAFSTVLIKIFRKELAARFLSYSGVATETIQLPVESSAGQTSETSRQPKMRKALQHLRSRLMQAAKLGKRNVILSEIYIWSARALSFVQYIVGGVLTLSFVKQSFSPALLGVFGVIVFVASGLNQRFNPSANAEACAQRADQLEALVRDTEDTIIAIETTSDETQDDPAKLLALTKKVSSEITRIRAISTHRKTFSRN